jgi:hypothetical protein
VISPFIRPLLSNDGGCCRAAKAPAASALQTHAFRATPLILLIAAAQRAQVTVIECVFNQISITYSYQHTQLFDYFGK